MRRSIAGFEIHRHVGPTHTGSVSTNLAAGHSVIAPAGPHLACGQSDPGSPAAGCIAAKGSGAEEDPAPEVTYTETVEVVSERLVDVRATEVATNVTQEQIQHLPQNSRNFLNFAALAPGLRVSDNELRKEFSAGALPSQNVNVFIDGVSYKNDVIDGGVVGQDASRGNPFPQSAVQEFKVLTQNFKAEYEKAASAIITAITRSGGNRFAGELFNFYQDKGLVENEKIVRDPSGLLVKGRTTPRPEYERWQWGASLGGPIVVDRAQFFGSYEENRQDRANSVIVGTVSDAPAALVNELRTREGTFTSPFREKLFFGKGSWQPAQDQQLEVTYSWRDETDIRGFGGATSFEAAENVRNSVNSLQGKWQLAGSTFLNEAYLSYQRYRSSGTHRRTTARGMSAGTGVSSTTSWTWTPGGDTSGWNSPR